jgi:hypothetical protein
MRPSRKTGTCLSENRISHILVFQSTEYPIYLYFRGQNIPYTCNSEDRISHILVIQMIEYPIYLYFRWQSVPYFCKFVCVICSEAAGMCSTDWDRVGAWGNAAFSYCHSLPRNWPLRRKIGLLPYVVEQSISRSRCRLYSRIWRYGDRTTCDEFYRGEGGDPYHQQFPKISTKWVTRQCPSSLEPYSFS